ncbi:MAG: BamA/OMP85 family outer membrane protein, partial [Vulcanimicrobiaceae bacterium]
MTFDLRRAPSALVRCAVALLALIVLVTFVAPSAAFSATGPKIVSVDVTGNLHVPTSTIMAVVQAQPGTTYNPKVVQGDLARINALGYFADIAPPLVRERPGGIAITYRVIENPVLTAINFIGNNTVKSDTLLALMDLSVGQVFNTNTFRQDVLKINNYYERIGFGGQVPTHVKDINLDSKTGSLTLTIQEGLTIRKVIIGGDPLLPPQVLLPMLAAKPGVVFSDSLRLKDTKTLQKFYDDKLHIELGNFEGGIDPSSIDLKNGTADVKYDIYVARVVAVQITGNTRTKDQVIRRELLVRPGMVVNTDAIKRDYERLNALGYFSKVEPDFKPGEPDPKKPQDGTLVWHVTEQRTASASVGFGYSGGITGQGLYGTLGYQDSNLHGTGNSASLQFQRGARTNQSQLSVGIPYLGNTPKTQKYSLSTSLFQNSSTYYYPVYSIGTTAGIVAVPVVGGTPAPIPVTLYPSTTSSQISGIVATSASSSLGAQIQLGRRLSIPTSAFVGFSGQQVKYNTTVPTPYFFQGAQPNVLIGPTPGPLNSNTSNINGSFGIAASSIANVNTGQPYQLNQASFGFRVGTLDDPYNPRTGVNATLNESISTPGIGSSFSYTQTTLDIARFFPVLKNATFGIHGVAQLSTGIIPPSALFTFSDQQMRGYQQVFYGTDAYLGQAELRQPLTADRKLTLAFFVDELDYRIRGAQPLLDPYTNRIVGYPGNWSLRGDYGFGFRFDVPQLGLRTVRVDFAKGAN